VALRCTTAGCPYELTDQYATECPDGHPYDPDAGSEVQMRAVTDLAPPPGQQDKSVATPGPTIVVLVGGRRVRATSPVELGRALTSPAASVFEPYPNVSRSHATIQVVGTELEVRDLGSKNGTFVRGRGITLEQVPSGEQIRLARNCQVTLYIDGSGAPGRPP
jgi:hypothetical protein